MTQTASSPATQRIAHLIHDELPSLVEFRHDLHAHPELGYQEQRTSEAIRRELAAAGIEFVGDLAGGTGVMAHLPAESGGAIGLRADMDALPIQEQTGLPYASQNEGLMHACGHDGHTTMLLGTARVLAQLSREGSLPRPVSFVFQPAEEGGAGGERMVNEGCLDGSIIGPPIDMMFGQHGWPRLPLGVVGTRPGPMLAAADQFDITISGQGSHAAWPHKGRDPIVTAAAIITALQTISSRNINPVEPIVVSVTKINGGTTHNIIHRDVEIAGTVRTLSDENQQIAMVRLKEIASGVAQAHGCEADIRYETGYPVTFNSPAAVDVFNRVAKDALGSERVINMPEPAMGGEDFSYYGRKVPACFFALGLDPNPDTPMPDLHLPTFNFNDNAIPIGVELFCRLALSV